MLFNPVANDRTDTDGDELRRVDCVAKGDDGPPPRARKPSDTTTGMHSDATAVYSREDDSVSP